VAYQKIQDGQGHIQYVLAVVIGYRKKEDRYVFSFLELLLGIKKHDQRLFSLGEIELCKS